jgi:hypothetical protein
VRRYASSDPPERIHPETWPYPTYWLRPAQGLSIAAGQHRFVWNLRYAPPPGTARQLSIAATYHNTPTAPVGPFVAPGRFTVRLTVDGASSERPLDVRMDPRVTIGAEDLQRQTDLSMACYRGYLRAQAIRDGIDGALEAASDPARRAALMALRGEGAPGAADILYDSITAVPPDKETVVGLQEKLLFMLALLQSADARPTAQAADAVRRLEQVVPALEARWAAMRSGA